MSSSPFIADADQIQDSLITIYPSSLKIEPTSGAQLTPSLRLNLALLQPLAEPCIMKACRNPASRILSAHPSGRTSRTPLPEVLDLTALDKAWRRTVNQMLPASAIIFNISLPQPAAKFKINAEPEAKTVAKGNDSEDGFQKIYWSVSAPDTHDAVLIELRDVMRIAVTIASTTRMRVPRGETLWFDVVFNEEDNPSVRGVDQLKSQLKAISQSPVSQNSSS